MKPLIFLAFLMALLVLYVLEAHADDSIHGGTVSNTGLSFTDMADGRRVFTSSGFAFIGRASGSGYIGRLQMVGDVVDHPAFYRLDMGMIVILDTGVVCTDVSTLQTVCK